MPEELEKLDYVIRELNQQVLLVRPLKAFLVWVGPVLQNDIISGVEAWFSSFKEYFDAHFAGAKGSSTLAEERANECCVNKCVPSNLLFLRFQKTREHRSLSWAAASLKEDWHNTSSVQADQSIVWCSNMTDRLAVENQLPKYWQVTRVVSCRWYILRLTFTWPQKWVA